MKIQKNDNLQMISDKDTKENIQMKEAAFWAASFPYKCILYWIAGKMNEWEGSAA